MPPGPLVPRRRNLVSKAVRLLRDAPESPCPHCGRTTKTTSDGVCADCWERKDGRRYAPVAAPPPRWAVRFANLLTFRRR
jgi:hypothetical protein